MWVFFTPNYFIYSQNLLYNHFATPSESLLSIIPVAIAFNSSTAFSTAYDSSAISNISISFFPSPNATGVSRTSPLQVDINSAVARLHLFTR